MVYLSKCHSKCHHLKESDSSIDIGLIGWLTPDLLRLRKAKLLRGMGCCTCQFQWTNQSPIAAWKNRGHDPRSLSLCHKDSRVARDFKTFRWFNNVEEKCSNHRTLFFATKHSIFKCSLNKLVITPFLTSKNYSTKYSMTPYTQRLKTSPQHIAWLALWTSLHVTFYRASIFFLQVFVNHFWFVLCWLPIEQSIHVWLTASLFEQLAAREEILYNCNYKI